MLRPKILERGYINVYSELTDQERRGLLYQRKYKKLNPAWDQTNIVLCQYFGKYGGKRVLDAGCGNGNYVVDECRNNIKFAAGVDIDRESTRKNIGLDEIKYSNLEAIPYPDNYFDTVISLWVLEHLENPKNVFGEIFRVLKGGGYFIFATPNKNSWLLRVKRLMTNNLVNIINKKLYGRGGGEVFITYYRANTTVEIKTLLKEVGFGKIKLQLNYDPAFTSFNELTFRLSNLINDKQHVIGLTRK